MEYSVYILRSLTDHRRYIGVTADIQRRLAEHTVGMVKSTRHRLPVELVYQEKFTHKSDALLREKFFKTGKGREFLNALEI